MFKKWRISRLTERNLFISNLMRKICTKVMIAFDEEAANIRTYSNTLHLWEWFKRDKSQDFNVQTMNAGSNPIFHPNETPLHLAITELYMTTRSLGNVRTHIPTPLIHILNIIGYQMMHR